MKMTKRQKLIACAAALAGLALALAGGARFWWLDQSERRSNDDSSARQAAVDDASQVAAIRLDRREAYERTVSHTGTIVSKRHTAVAFQRPGLVTDVLIEEGAIVELNQTLAQLDQRQLQAKKDGLVGKVKQAQAVLRELKKGPRPETIEAARNAVTDLEQQLRAQELRLERSRKLVESNAIAEQDYERELYSKRGLEARLKRAQSQLDELLAGTRQEKIDAQNALIESMQGELKTIQHDLEDGQLKAPFLGIIVDRFIDPGSVVDAGTPIVELLDHRNLEFHVGLPIAAAERLPEGWLHRINTRSHEWNGKLRVVLPQVDEDTRTRKAIFEIAAPDERDSNPFAGQLARIELTRTVPQAGFWIPRQALVADHSGLWSCLTIEKEDGPATTGRATKQTVEILHQRNDQVFVRGTLHDGQILISDGLHKVVPGQKVTATLRKPDVENDSDRLSDRGTTLDPVREP